MPQDQQDQAGFDHHREQLKLYIGMLMDAFMEEFPDGAVYPSPAYPEFSGYAGDGPMRSIAAPIDDVLASFDALQEFLGLRRESEPRHRRFCNGD